VRGTNIPRGRAPQQTRKTDGTTGALEFPPGRGDIHTVQIGKPPANIRQILDALTGERRVHVILWARDHRTYRTIVDELERTGQRLQ
jgi:hypothetical protein